MNRDEKRDVVERLVEQIKEAKALIVTDYRGLTVTETAERRRALREAGASFHVAKNTLAKLAAEQAERPTLIEFLEGPTAIAFIDGRPGAGRQEAVRGRALDQDPGGQGRRHERPHADGGRGPRSSASCRRARCCCRRWSAPSPARRRPRSACWRRRSATSSRARRLHRKTPGGGTPPRIQTEVRTRWQSRTSSRS